MKITSSPMFLKRIWLAMLSVGPGIFCIGYTIGTGSVTSMAKAGSAYGMKLLWVLLLSCLFAWVLMEAYGRYAVTTGRTAMNSFKTEFRFGKAIATLTIIGIVIGQWTALAGLMGLAANLVYESLVLFVPSLPEQNRGYVILIASVILVIFYAMLWIGRYSLFEKILIVFVTLMGLGFILSMLVVMPSAAEIAGGIIPSIPDQPGALLMVCAFVGTTMAAPTFVVRPLLMRGKGWGIQHQKLQRRDALVSASLMFLISGAVMACATGAIFKGGRSIESVLDMVVTLEPVAGHFAVALFMIGTLSAGLSSIFPIAMVAPLLISDYRDGQLKTRTLLFRVLTAVACAIGLTIPVLGANPISAQIATQVATVFVLPVVIAGITYLVNSHKLMGSHRAGWLLNLGLGTSFVFACIISILSLQALREFFF